MRGVRLCSYSPGHILTDSDLDLGADTTNCNAEPTSQCQKLISYVRGTDTYNVKARPG